MKTVVNRLAGLSPTVNILKRILNITTGLLPGLLLLGSVLLFLGWFPTIAVARSGETNVNAKALATDNALPYPPIRYPFALKANVSQAVETLPGGIQRIGENSEYADISVDGRYIAFANVSGVNRYDVETGMSELVVSGVDASEVAISPDGRFIAYVVPGSGYSDLFLYDYISGVAENISAPLGGGSRANSGPSVAGDGSVAQTTAVAGKDRGTFGLASRTQGRHD